MLRALLCFQEFWCCINYSKKNPKETDTAKWIAGGCQRQNVFLTRLLPKLCQDTCKYHGFVSLPQASYMAVLDSGFVNYTWEVFIILDADNEYRAAEMQKQTEIQERTVKKRCSSVAISKRSRKQFLEPARKWQTICYKEFNIQAATTAPHLSLLELPNESSGGDICDFVTWFQSRVQDLGSRKGLLPAGTPTSKASLQAFCIQYCWSSAAAWETWVKKKEKQI